MEDHKAAKRKQKMAGKMEGDDSSDDDRNGSNIGGMKRIEANIEKLIKGIKTNHHL